MLGARVRQEVQNTWGAHAALAWRSSIRRKVCALHGLTFLLVSYIARYQPSRQCIAPALLSCRLGLERMHLSSQQDLLKAAGPLRNPASIPEAAHNQARGKPAHGEGTVAQSSGSTHMLDTCVARATHGELTADGAPAPVATSDQGVAEAERAAQDNLSAAMAGLATRPELVPRSVVMRKATEHHISGPNS